MSKKIYWPFGDADELALSATGAQALEIDNDLTVVDGVTVQGTGNRTLNLTISPEVKVGAKLVVHSKTNAIETTIFGTGITGTTITGEAGKTKTKTFTYNGTAFIADNEQID